MGDGTSREDCEALRREVTALRARVADLQRAAARHEQIEGTSMAEREELLREAERIAHLGTWTWDRVNDRVTWSDELFRILGLEPGRVTPSVEAFFACVHPEDLARVEEATEKSLREGVLPPVECRLVRPDGSVRHTVSTSSMLFDREGVPQRLVGGVVDRTEAVETERRLRSTLSLLEEAQRFAKLGSWRLVPSTGEVEWSPELFRIAGLPTSTEASVEAFFECIVPEDREKLRAAFARATGPQTGPEWEAGAAGNGMDARLRRPDGEERHVRLSGFAVARADGQTELRGTMLDITDQVRLREERAHAQKMEAVGRLAGGIAHDFNNLLTVVFGHLDRLQERIGDAPELDGSLQALTSATNLTRRLLAFGRKAQLKLERTSPNALVRSTVDLMRRLVGDEVRLELDLDPHAPDLLVDCLEVERALVNLVVNARDAMPAGGVVRIGTAARYIEGALHVELSVADQGAGIDERDLPHIFEPFYTTRNEQGGSGLGLATVLGTAQQHGGSVRVDASAGGGAVFTVALPAANQVRAKNTDHTSLPAPTADAPSLQVLVVDDEPMVAAAVQQMLEMAGHAVEVATEPAEALRLWSQRGAHIDLVLCDVAMARLRGPQLIERLAEAGPEPRVLFMTGYSDEAVSASLGHPVIAKPFTARVLWRAVREAVGEAHVPDEVDEAELPR